MPTTIPSTGSNKNTARTQPTFLIECRNRARANKAAFDTFKALLAFSLKNTPSPAISSRIFYLNTILKVLEDNAAMLKANKSMHKYVLSTLNTIRGQYYPELVASYDSVADRQARASIAASIRDINNRICTITHDVLE